MSSGAGQVRNQFQTHIFHSLFRFQVEHQDKQFFSSFSTWRKNQVLLLRSGKLDDP
jgi:hypothetical protein